MRQRGFTRGENPNAWKGGFTDYNRRVESPAARVGVSLDEYEAKRAAGLKWCSACRGWHPLDQFAPNRWSHDGLDGYCRDGRRAYRRKYARRGKQP